MNGLLKAINSKAFFLKRLISLWVAFFCLAGLPAAYAQYENESDAAIPLDKFYIKRQGAGLRGILSKFHFGLSTGFGSTTLSHTLDGFGILQNVDSMPKIYQSKNIAAGYSNWVNNAVPSTNSVLPGAFTVNSDTTSLGFKAKAFSIPFKATVHYEFNRYRIGGGYSIEYMHIGDFHPISYADKIKGFSPGASSFFLKKYFVMLGGMVYRYNEYALVVDANIGGYKLGSQFNNSLIKTGVYVNLGVTAEREMSEYLRLFARPSYEFKSYKLSTPESGTAITHSLNAFYINVGLTYRFPELRKCFLKDCHAQLNHAHGNKEYRSRRHPFYKKQNPHYGENYPVLLKYKGRNKNKLNPY